MKLDYAFSLVEKGFHLFPLIPNGKTPLHKGWQLEATQDTRQIEEWFSNDKYNIGISCDRFNGSQGHLAVIDVDRKEFNGEMSLMDLQLEGKEFPQTAEQLTTTNGRHIIYYSKTPIKNTAGRLGQAIDTRGVGGYIVGAGSTIDGKKYDFIDRPVMEAPAWLIEACTKDGVEILVDAASDINIDYVTKRAKEYLATLPWAEKGNRAVNAFKAAAQLKDYGLSQADCFEVMQDSFQCSPELGAEELSAQIRSAYKYAKNAIGSKAPESFFNEQEKSPDKSYLELMNDKFALVTSSNHYYLQETTDASGINMVRFLTEASFKAKFKNKKVVIGDDKKRSQADLWIEWPGRRDYDDVVFLPGIECPKNYYNLWRGFSVDPVRYKDATADAKEGFDMYIDHVFKNMSAGRQDCFDYIMTYIAHMIQKPSERAQTALVFSGSKGTGKSVFTDILGSLFPSNYVVARDIRYLTGNFNSHFSDCLLFVADEAFWSGDKKAESALKGLITGEEILIERKGFDPKKQKNVSRLIVTGNDEWLVPAGVDERRFAVFGVAENLKLNSNHFVKMKKQLKAGGLSVLLDYLQRWDIDKVDITHPPKTKELNAQKEAGLGLIEKWWRVCLEDGILYGTYDGQWPTEILAITLQESFNKYLDSIKYNRRRPDVRIFGKTIKGFNGVIRTRLRLDGERKYIMQLLPIEECRENFEKYLGFELEWNE